MPCENKYTGNFMGGSRPKRLLCFMIRETENRHEAENIPSSNLRDDILRLSFFSDNF